MVEHGFVNVEPIMRDALVSSLPFQPTCYQTVKIFVISVVFALKTQVGSHHGN